MTQVLDYGEVILVDSMADDGKVVNAARVSTGKESLQILPKEPGQYYTAEQAEKDQKLINYLMANGHGTPFEHAVFQFFVKCPIFVAREWQRHRVASYNEFSLRYAEVTDETAEFYIPDHMREVDSKNKQSSVVSADEARTAAYRFAVTNWSMHSLQGYRDMIEAGVAREMARMVLPVNIYTKFWFTVNARSLMNFLMLRNHSNAQWEIMVYAKAIEEMFAEKMPWTYDAFVSNGRIAP